MFVRSADKGRMNSADVSALCAQVLWASLALSVALGAIAQRTRFCTMEAIMDAVTMEDRTRVRMSVLGIATAVLGFNAMVGLGWIDARNSTYAGLRVPLLFLFLCRRS